MNALVFSRYFVGLILAPTCRNDGGNSEPRWPRWPRPLPGDCAGAAGRPALGPVRRSGRTALPGAVLLHRDYGRLSRPRAPQRAQEYPPQYRETVSSLPRRGKAQFPRQNTSHGKNTRFSIYSCVNYGKKMWLP